MAQYRNPTNGYTEGAHMAFLWCLLFGPLYFVFKGVMRHALISLVLVMVTGGLAWLVYPFLAGSLVRAHYARQGWVRLG